MDVIESIAHAKAVFMKKLTDIKLIAIQGIVTAGMV
jgi:hypothetical protein